MDEPRAAPPGLPDEHELGAAEFDALLDAAVDGIIVTDESARILRFNRAAEHLFGYTETQVTGQNVRLIMNDRDARAHDRYMRTYMETGRKKIIGIGREVVARHRGGREFPVDLAIGEVRLRGERRFVGLIRDLTAQKRAEEEALRHREEMNHVSRLTTMGEMAAAMAHELNQPLTAIANYTAACRRLLELGDEARDEVCNALAEIGNQALRAGDVIQRIRDFARSREVARQAVRVDELMGDILPLARMDAKANGVDLRVLVEPSLPPLVADPVQIQQVILNLLRNGVDAMESIPEPERRLDLRAFLDDPQHVKITITDRGPGVGEEAAEQLFNPFFTTKAAGMGMGLAISRSIIAAHGGKLDFINNPVVGATFYLTLPTSPEDA